MSQASVFAVSRSVLSRMIGNNNFRPTSAWRYSGRIKQTFIMLSTTTSTVEVRDQDPLVAIPSTIKLPDGKDGDKVAPFLNYLTVQTSLSDERRVLRHWINIHWTKLRQLIGRDYAPRIKELEAMGIIEINHRYSTGELSSNGQAFTKSFRFGEKHCHGKSASRAITASWAKDRARKVYEIDEENLRPAGMHFRLMFEHFSISPDALQDRKLSSSWAKSAIVRWLNGEEFATRCDYGRYHCLASQLPREARKYLRVRGDGQLCVVDVSACQPLILGVLAGNWSRDTSRHETPTSYYPYAARFCRSEIPKDVSRWIGLCESADKDKRLYSFLQDRLQAAIGPALVTINRKDGRIVRRDLKKMKPKEFKRCVLIPLFDDAAQTKANPTVQLIECDFPTIAKFILCTKAGGNYQRTAWMCQMAESGVMIDDVGARLLRDFPHEPVQPIHDAIVCRVAFAETVREIIRDCFQASLGVLPNVEIESIAGT